MSNIHTHFDGLTDDEFLEVRSRIIKAVDAVGEGKVDMKRKTNGTVTANITDIVVESLEKMQALIALLGPNAEWMSDDQMEDARRIAA